MLRKMRVMHSLKRGENREDEKSAIAHYRDTAIFLNLRAKILLCSDCIYRADWEEEARAT